MLLPIKRILCPTDFSDPSYLALKNAIELAAHFEAEVCLLHVLPEIPKPTWVSHQAADEQQVGENLSEYGDWLHRCAQQKLHEVIQQVVKKGVISRALVSKGDAAYEIVRVAEDERADLIVIATHGMTGWPQIAFGSVVERVVRLSNCPVLTVRAPRVKR
jgi:nucleotide-binding universal stress UspA family protein